MIGRLALKVLEWAAGHADEGRYSPVAIVFHWTMAAMAIFQLGLGWWMGRRPVGGEKAAAYELHYGLGLVMLLLILGRSAWRAFAPEPVNDADKPGWESTAAHVTHYVFYACLLGLPLSGWAMVSATGQQTELTLLGLAAFPILPFQDLSNPRLWALEAAAEWAHWGLVVTLLALIPIHVVAALKHHLIDRDDVLHGMLPILPQRPRRAPLWVRRYLTLERAVLRRAMRLWPQPPAQSAARRRRS